MIHPPNSPIGHTDEMYSCIPAGRTSLMCDGSVRFIKEAIHLSVWSALCSRSVGEVISSEAY